MWVLQEKLLGAPAVSSTDSIPSGFCNQKLWGLIFLVLEPWPQAGHLQPRFTAWIPLEISKPSSSRLHLRLIYTSGRVSSGKTQVGADLGLHHSGNLRASAPIDHVRAPPPCPFTADPPQGASSGGHWSQPVLAADWPEKIPPVDLLTATKDQLQDKDVLNPHKG